MEEDNKNNKIRKYVGKYILILITQNSTIISCVQFKCMTIIIQKSRAGKQCLDVLKGPNTAWVVAVSNL